MTSLTNNIARSIGKLLTDKSNIIVTQLDHDANVSPWVLAANDRNATVKVIKVDKSNCQLNLDELKTKVDENNVFKNPVQRKVPFSLKKLTRATICDSTSYEHIDKLQIPEVLKEFLKEHCYMHTNPEGVYYDVLSPLLSPKN